MTWIYSFSLSHTDIHKHTSKDQHASTKDKKREYIKIPLFYGRTITKMIVWSEDELANGQKDWPPWHMCIEPASGHTSDSDANTPPTLLSTSPACKALT